MVTKNVDGTLVDNNNLAEESPEKKSDDSFVPSENFTTDPNFRHVYVKKLVVAHVILQGFGLLGLHSLIFHAKLLTTLWALILGILGTTIGIALGAHRFYAHKAFKANVAARWLFIVMHTLSGQNSMLRWVKEHRLHHWYSDTDVDPHNAERGLFFSHMGWLMVKRHPLSKEKQRQMDVSDLLEDKIIMFQYKYFVELYFLVGFLFPVIVPIYVWDEDAITSILVAYFLRYTVSLHITWTLNSFSHIWGNRPYDKRINPSQLLWVWLVTGGEGWHNFHHSFPWDSRLSEFGQRNGLGTIILDLLVKLGMAYDAKTVPTDVLKRHMRRHGDGTTPWMRTSREE